MKTRIHATLRDDDDELVISGSLRLLRAYEPDLARQVAALLLLLKEPLPPDMPEGVPPPK